MRTPSLATKAAVVAATVVAVVVCLAYVVATAERREVTKPPRHAPSPVEQSFKKVAEQCRGRLTMEYSYSNLIGEQKISVFCDDFVPGPQ